MQNEKNLSASNEDSHKDVFQLQIDNSIKFSKNRYKYLTTFTLYFCSMAYGITSYIIGPALNDMRIRLDTTLDNIAIVFACVLLGYTLGAIINGAIFNYINRQLVLVCLLFIMGCTIALAPHCASLGLLFGDVAIAGFGAGGFDTAQVVWIIELWAEKSAAFLQGIQFFFALGTFVSPLMTRPFLDRNGGEQTSLRNTTIQPEELRHRSRIEIPFGIVGSILAFSALLLLILHFYKRYDPPIKQNQECVCKRPSFEKLIYIILGLFTLAPYVGMEIMNFQLMSSFAHNSHLKLSDSESADVLTFLAGAFTLGRALSILISIKYSPEKMIFANYIIIIIANIILLLFQLDQNCLLMLWIGNITIGFGFSSVFPAVYAFLEKHITISNTMGAFFVCTSGLMAGLLPTVCGQYIEDSPLVLVYINFICVFINCCAFTIFNILTRYKP